MVFVLATFLLSRDQGTDPRFHMNNISMGWLLFGFRLECDMKNVWAFWSDWIAVELVEILLFASRVSIFKLFNVFDNIHFSVFWLSDGNAFVVSSLLVLMGVIFRIWTRMVAYELVEMRRWLVVSVAFSVFQLDFTYKHCQIYDGSSMIE